MTKATFLFLHLVHHRRTVFGLVSMLLLALPLSGCRDYPADVHPADDRPILAPEEYGDIVLTLTDFNTVQVTHRLGPDLRSDNIVGVGVGTKDTSGYTELLEEESMYDPAAGSYIIGFGFSLVLDSLLSEVPLTVRYHLIDSSYVDADTTVLSYKYPYATAEIIVPFAAMESLLHGHHLQDVDRVGPSVFFHPMAHFGMYVFDTETGEITELLPYSGGDHIAAESDYVFCDVDHDRIIRYNMILGETDITIIGPGAHGDETIRGMDVYDGHLYVQRDRIGLTKYTLDGLVVDSLDFINDTYLTIDDGIIYTVGFGELKRFDMEAGIYLENVLAPARQTEGIKAYDGMLYYCDYDKRMIGAVPVDDLRAVE